MKLYGKVAVVTGAASGMGKAIAILYAKEGAKVIVSDINLDGAKETVAEIEIHGGIATAVLADIAKEEDVKYLINNAVDNYGTLDILINNAGIMDNFTPLAEVTDELWERVFNINITGSMRTIRQALPIFIHKNSGIIINISSIGGLYGSRAGAAYTASKHALIGLTKNVGFQYGKLGIRCNAIAPGGVNTNIAADMLPNEFGMERAMSGMNLNIRMGESEEIAKIALFLGTEDSSLINGAIITADAGMTAY